MSESRLRVAQIGVGGMGLAHVNAIRASRRAELVAVCDPVAAALEAADPSGTLPRYADADALFDAGGFDALVAVLPHDLYPHVVERAAQAGVHVLKEKPFARNLSDALAMHAAVNRSGIKFLCAAQRQYSSTFQQARELLDTGAVGDVFLVQATIYYRWLLDPALWAWRGEYRRSGGIAVVDSGWHILDAVAWLKGLPSQVHCRVGAMRAVEGSYDVDDKAVMTLDFPDGAVGSVSICFVTKPDRYEVLLHGTRGTLQIDTSQLLLHPRDGGEPQVWRAGQEDVMQLQFEHFLDVVLDGATPRVGIEEALQVQRVVEAAYESAASGRPVALS